jgi:flagellar biosynthesis protein FliQ
MYVVTLKKGSARETSPLSLVPKILAAIHYLVAAEKWSLTGCSAYYFAATQVTDINTVLLSLLHLLLSFLLSFLTHYITTLNITLLFY